MKISTKGRYAIRLMIDIARHSSGENVSLKDVSKRQDISVKYLEQIVSMLSKAGFLRSQRGSQGGYKMTRKPEEYTILDILEVTEGGIAPIACLEDEVNQCPKSAKCPTIALWRGLYDATSNYLKGITIADLVRKAEENDDDFGYYI